MVAWGPRVAWFSRARSGWPLQSEFVTNPTTPAAIAAASGSRFAPLDGVRAAAVLVVVAYHGVEPHRFGGYVGVDVFFVLSGFLITTLLLRELDRYGEIWVGGFYARRFVRLYPPLLALLVVLLVPGLLLAPSTLRFLAENLMALTYTTVIGSSAHGVAGMAYLHTWSLGVEELFYIFWPALLLLAFRRGVTARRLVLLCVVVAVALLGLDVMLAARGGERGLLRAGGIALGCALAITLHDRPRARAGAVVGTGGAAAIVSAVVLGLFIPFSAIPMTVAAVGTVALVAHLVTVPDGRLARLLAWRPAAYLGEISYEIYLWHFPLLTLGCWAFGGLPSDQLWWVLPVTLALASASHRLLTPLQQRWKARFPYAPNTAAMAAPQVVASGPG